jgi:hypothetical protein
MTTNVTQPTLPQPRAISGAAGDIVTDTARRYTADDLVFIYALSRARAARGGNDSRVIVSRDVERALARTPSGRS